MDMDDTTVQETVVLSTLLRGLDLNGSATDCAASAVTDGAASEARAAHAGACQTTKEWRDALRESLDTGTVRRATSARHGAVLSGVFLQVIDFRPLGEARALLTLCDGSKDTLRAITAPWVYRQWKFSHGSEPNENASIFGMDITVVPLREETTCFLVTRAERVVAGGLIGGRLAIADGESAAVSPAPLAASPPAHATLESSVAYRASVKRQRPG